VITPSVARSPAPRTAPSEGPLAAWLFDTAQCASGPHAGAVAGRVDASGSASYVYPEIAGYYLQWLAWRATRWPARADLSSRAAAVERWLARWLAMQDTPTRIHLDGTRDWRNGATFCFDLSMVLRGLAAAARANLIAPDTRVVDGVSRALARLIAHDGSFDACVANGSAAVPSRWSTRRGPFLAKAAAGVLRASAVLPRVTASIARAAERTFATSAAMLATEPHEETHALLYAFEGVLNLPRHPRFHDALPLVAAQFDDLLSHAASDGYLPESIAGRKAEGPARIDVMAQALRIGYLLAAHRPQQPPDRVALARIRQTLSRQVRAGSGMPFARGDCAHGNVWATMFTDQALAFAAPERDADAWWRVDPMIV
jgi:hypothetical protein